MRSGKKLLSALSAAALWLFSTQVWASSGWFHVELPDDSPVPVAGWPYFIEDLTTGSPLSDFASHAGVKASVRLDFERVSGEPVLFDNFLNMAHYACWAQSYMSRQWDQSYVSLEGLPEPEGRSINFMPWGWEESVAFGNVRATSQTIFMSEDVLMLRMKFVNSGESDALFRIRLNFFSDADDNLETTYLASKENDSCNLEEKESGRFIYDCNDGRNGLRFHFLRKIALLNFSGGGAHIENIRNQQKNGTAWLESSEIELKNSGGLELVFIIAYGRKLADASDGSTVSSDELDSKLQVALDELSGMDAREKVAELKARWSFMQQSLGTIHMADEKYKQLARLAQTALVHNLYAPTLETGKLASLPAKVYHNDMRPWHAAIQAAGLAEFDSQSAKDVLTYLFSRQESSVREIDGMLPARIGDDSSDYGETQPFSAPPEIGWIIEQVYYADGGWDKDWLSAMYSAAEKHLSFWLNRRDRDLDSSLSGGNGLYEYASAEEAGWGDSPRYGCALDGTNVCEQFGNGLTEAVDLNSMLFEYMRSMARLAQILGRPIEEKEIWEKKAYELEQRIEDGLWNPAMRAWDDRSWDGDRYVFSGASTPVIAWPLAAGASHNPFHISSAVQTLTNPASFWGSWNDDTPTRWPMPTMAYNSPQFDSLQDGYYRQGQIWPLLNYTAVKALWRYGYADKAEELKEGTLALIMQASEGGIFDAYDAESGAIGWAPGSYNREDYRENGGVGEPSPFQYGMSASVVLQLLYERYQRERYLMPGDIHVAGFIREMRRLSDDALFISVETGDLKQPWLEISSLDGRPLSETSDYTLRLSDPYGEVDAPRIIVTMPGLVPGLGFVSAVDSSGNTELLESKKEDYFEIEMTRARMGAIDHFRISDLSASGGNDEEAGGCSSMTDFSDGMRLAALLLLAFMIRRISRQEK